MLGRIGDAVVIKNDFYKRWVAENGQARLDLIDSAAPFPPFTQERVKNENGVLFLAYFLVLLKLGEIDDATDRNGFSNLVHDLQEQFGLYNRHPGNHEALEAHDDYVGIAAVSSLFGFPFASQILQYGTKTGFCFNNLSPGTYAVEAQLQGGDIAFIAMCAGWVPELWNYAWFCGAILLNAFQSSKSPNNPASSTLLGWIKVVAITDALSRDKTFPKWVAWSWPFVALIFHLGLKRKYGGIKGAFAQYFSPMHPCVRLSELMG